VFVQNTSSEKASSEKASSEKASSEKASSEKASSEKASPTTDTVVPDLRGKTVSEAAQMVGTDYVLEVETVWGKDLTDPDNEPKGTIVSQDPYPSHGERETPRGSVITVSLSGGQDDVVVPEVTGLSVLQAAKILLDAGLKPYVFKVRFDQNGTPVAATNPGDKEDVSQRTVTEATLAESSLPAAGSKTEPGDIVFLSYS
jgi:beta-lactam-binding protein with PASTA domain